MRHPFPVLAGSALCALAGFAPVSAVAFVATSAADVCEAGADPCVVSQPIEVAGSLDFGLRTLRVEGAGVVEVAAAGVAIACGRLDLRTSGAAVRASGGSAISLLARRACSLAPQVACLTEADCAPLAAGDCSAGDGTASIDGTIVADGETAGDILVRAAGDVLVRALVAARGTRAEADGGTVEIESTTGAVAIEAVIDVSGGGLAGGGDIDVLAAADLVVRAPLRATGGDYDGGQLWLAAGRDALVLEDVSASAAAGAGFGGALVVEAGRDAMFDGGTATNKVTIDVDGHQSIENYGGDGGTIEVEAGRDLVATQHVRFAASGAAPDGYADALSFAADGALRFGATVVAKGRGLEGGGAIVDLASEAEMEISSTASFDLTGAAIAGDLALESGGALAFAGDVDVSSSPSGVAGRILAIADADAMVSGRWTTSGGASSFSTGDLYLEACDASVTGTLSNAAEAGRTTIVARESAHVGATAFVVTGGLAATNTIVHRRADLPPVLEGVVRPTASVLVDETLEPCSGCTSSADRCEPAPLCRELCEESGCSTAELFAASLVLRSGREGTSGIWKGGIASPGRPLSDADLRVIAAGADSGLLFDVTLPAGSLRAAGAGWRLRSVDASSPVRKAVFRPVSDAGLLRARIKLARLTDALAAEDAVALALVVADPALRDDGSDGGDLPCADSGPLVCERFRRRTLCGTAP